MNDATRTALTDADLALVLAALNSHGQHCARLADDPHTGEDWREEGANVAELARKIKAEQSRREAEILDAVL